MLQDQEVLEDQEVEVVEDQEDVDVAVIEEVMEVIAEEDMEIEEEVMGEREEDVDTVDVVAETGRVDMVEAQTATDAEVASVEVADMVVEDTDVEVVVAVATKEEEEVVKKECLTAKASRPLLIS